MTTEDPVQGVEWTGREMEALEAIAYGTYRAQDEARTKLARLIAARVAAARPATEREVKQDVWNAGFSRGFYDVLAGGDHDASESEAINPYEIGSKHE